MSIWFIFFCLHICGLISQLMRAAGLNECQTSNGGCSDICIDDTVGYHCACPEGLVLASDGRNCIASGNQSIAERKQQQQQQCRIEIDVVTMATFQDFRTPALNHQVHPVTVRLNHPAHPAHPVTVKLRLSHQAAKHQVHTKTPAMMRHRIASHLTADHLTADHPTVNHPSASHPSASHRIASHPTAGHRTVELHTMKHQMRHLMRHHIKPRTMEQHSTFPLLACHSEIGLLGHRMS
jgi:hypothetical protein